MLVTLVQPLFSLETPAMPIWVLIKSKSDQVHKFQCIYFGSFQTHLLVVAVYHSVRVDHGIDLGFVFKIFSCSFGKIIVSACVALLCQVTVKFSLSW